MLAPGKDPPPREPRPLAGDRPQPAPRPATDTPGGPAAEAPPEAKASERKAKRPALSRIIRRAVFEIGFLSLILNVLLLVVPLYLLQVYDRVLPTSSLETLAFLSLIAGFAMLVLGVLEIVRSLYSQRLAASIDVRHASSAFAASLSGAQAEGGDIQPLRDLGTIRSYVASRALAALFDLPFIPLFTGLLYFVHPVLFWLTAGGAALMVLLVLANERSARRTANGTMDALAATNLYAQAFSRNADSLRAMGMQRHATEAWGRTFARYLSLHEGSSTINSVYGGISRATRMVIQLATLGAGAWLVLAGEMTAGMIFAASIISGRALQPLDQIIGAWRPTVEARRSWLRLSKAIEREATGGAPRVALPEPRGAVAAENLYFHQPGAPPGSPAIIRGLNFAIEAGESVALIGANRAGKSTLARLLVGALEPSAGMVKIDGADRRTWDPLQLGRSIGYLAQDIQLLPGTIAENIARFEPGAPDERVVEAARRAQAHETILSQPQGYNTPIGHSGATLSGGERQRIGLARAFYGDPRILVLDEPNSNLDAEGEAALQRALVTARAARSTIILVTHRLTFAAWCDRVMILRSGGIEAFGPSAEVLEKMGMRRKPEPAPGGEAPPRRMNGEATAEKPGDGVTLPWPLKMRSQNP